MQAGKQDKRMFYDVRTPEIRGPYDFSIMDSVQREAMLRTTRAYCPAKIAYYPIYYY